MKDAFDLWREWAGKDPETDMSTIETDIHTPVMALDPADRADRVRVNEAVRRHRAETIR